MLLRFFDNKKYFFAVTLLSVMALLPLWSNPGIFWDGWIYHLMIEREAFEEGIYKPYMQNGRFFSAYLIYWFKIFENPSSAALIISIFGIAISAGLFSSILIELNILDRGQAFWAGFLGAVHPGFEVAISLSTVNFQLAIPFFYFSLYLMVKARNAEKKLSFGLNFLSLVFLLVSFTGEATVFLAAWYFILVGGLNYRSFKQFLSRYLALLTQYWWLALTICFSAVVMFFFLRPTGDYAGVRLATFSMDNSARVVGHFIKDSIEIDIFGFACCLILLLFALFKKRMNFRALFLNNSNLFNALFIGVTGFFISIVPFILGARWPDVEGWSLRFFVFSTFPIGVIIVSSCALLSRSLENHYRKGLYAGVLSIFIASHIHIVWSHSLSWHVRWVRDFSVYQFIERNVQPHVGLLLIDESAPVIFGETYRAYELIALTQKALNRQNIMVDNYSSDDKLSFDAHKRLKQQGYSVTYDPFFKNAEFPVGCEVLFVNSSTIFGASTLKKIFHVLNFHLEKKFIKGLALINIRTEKC